MSTGRGLVAVLEAEFKDSAIQMKCIASAKAKIRKDLINRVFDDFPCLVNEKELQGYVDEFEILLLGEDLPDGGIDKLINEWVARINNKANENLFAFIDTTSQKEKKIDGLLTTYTALIPKIHTDFQIQEELLKLLEWEGFRGVLKQKKDQLVQAYVQALLQSIIAKAHQDAVIEKYQQNYNAVIGCINRSFQKSLELPSYAKLTAKDGVVGVSLLGGLGALAWGAYSFVSSFAKGSTTDESKKEAAAPSTTPSPSPNPTRGTPG